MKFRYLINETTKEEREKLVRNALAVSLIDADSPTMETMKFFQLYIDGKMEIDEIQREIIDRYKK